MVVTFMLTYDCIVSVSAMVVVFMLTTPLLDSGTGSLHAPGRPSPSLAPFGAHHRHRGLDCIVSGYVMVVIFMLTTPLLGSGTG